MSFLPRATKYFLMYKIISIDEEKESLPEYSPEKAYDFHVKSSKNANKKFDQELKKTKM